MRYIQDKGEEDGAQMSWRERRNTVGSRPSLSQTPSQHPYLTVSQNPEAFLQAEVCQAVLIVGLLTSSALFLCKHHEGIDAISLLPGHIEHTWLLLSSYFLNGLI